MNWDKSPRERDKEKESADIEKALSELGSLVNKFLGFKSKGILFIGTNYEHDGANKSFGYGIYKIFHTEKGDKLKLLAESSKLSLAIKKAEKILDCAHQYEYDTGWCKLCNVHKTMVE
jgi:hypothetical protein